MNARGEEMFTLFRYSNKDGLACNYVHGITQDKNGYLWIATEYGLSRFDGVHFRNYFMENTPSLPRNQFIKVYYTHEGKLLFGSYNGVVIEYDEKHDAFIDRKPVDFDTTYYKGVSNFYETRDGTLWMTTSAGVYSYNHGEERFDKDPVLTDSTAPFFLSGGAQDKFGRTFFGTYTGMLLFDKDGRHITQYDKNLFWGSMVSGMFYLDDNHLLATSFMGGIWIIEIAENGEIISTQQPSLPFNNITAVICDSKRRIWVGTAGMGLWRSTYDGSFHFEKIEPQNANQELLQKVHCLYEDNMGDIWIGTQNAGLLRYRSARNAGAIRSVDFSFPLVDGTSFANDDEGNLLVGSDGHGIFVLDKEYHIKRQITVEDGLSTNNVLSIDRREDGKFWVVMWAGEVCILDLKDNTITKLPYDGIEFPFMTCKSACQLPNGELWVVTAGDGIYQKKAGKKWERRKLSSPFLKYDDVWLEDVTYSPKNDVVWVISSGMVWRCEGEKNELVYREKINEMTHYPMVFFQGTCGRDGYLYAVSTQGVLRFSPDGKSYEKLDFLPKGQYSSIIQDERGVFWTAGSNGIISFDIRQKSFENVTIDDYSYSHYYYTCRASYIDRQGKLFFGNTEGFVSFNPDMLKKMNDVNYLNISQIYVKGEKREDILQDGKGGQTQKLVLNYDETELTINVDIIDFSGLNNVVTTYQLVGMEDKAHVNGNKREIHFSYIPPGKYTLQVEAKRQGSEEGMRHISLEIIVMPPWWKTWWFYTLSILFVVGIVSFFVVYRFRTIVKQRETLREKVEERTKELDESNRQLSQKQVLLESRNTELEVALSEKDRLIAVVAHDLKNPMFAIVVALDEMIKKQERESEKGDTFISLKNIYHAAFNLQNVMIKLLEWARGKAQEVACNLQPCSVRDIIKEVVDMLQPLFAEKRINVMSVDTKERYHKVLVDQRMVETAVRNVLSNSVKFCNEGGNITIKLDEDENHVIVRIQDNGVGMTEKQLTTINDDGDILSTKGTKNEKGTGLGLKLVRDYISQCGGNTKIESSEGQGTLITITLMKTEELDEEISHKEEIVQIEESTRIELSPDLTEGNSVLVVEDEPLISSHIKGVLENYFTVYVAQDGEEGYSMAKQQIPDIILSDVEMPKCNGLEMFDRIKKEETLQRVPLLFLSARKSEDDRLKGLYKGAIDYISKPFSDTELLLKINNILQVRRREQQEILKKIQMGTIEVENEEVAPLLRDVMKIVEENYTNSSFSAENICASMAMSKSTFSRKLKTITDKTPTEILTEYRLENAKKKIIENRDMTISEIAYSVGFTDPFYFSKKYKAYFGVSPSLQNSPQVKN